MKKGFLAHESVIFKLIVAIVLIFACFSIFFALGLVLAIPIFETDFFEILNRLNDLSDPENIRLLKYFQLVQSFGLFIVPPFLLAYAYYKKPASYLFLNARPYLLVILLILLTIVGMSPFINYLADFNSKLSLPSWLEGIENWMIQTEKSAEQLTESFLEVSSIPGFLFNILLIAILPAIGEELVFRGILQRLLSDLFRSSHIGIFLSAILFSAFHLQFFGFIPRLFLGLYFGYLLFWSGNIWFPITGHFLNNLMAVIYYYLVSTKGIESELDTIGTTPETLIYVPLSIIFLIIMSILTYGYLHKRAKGNL